MLEKRNFRKSAGGSYLIHKGLRIEHSIKSRKITVFGSRSAGDDHDRKRFLSWLEEPDLYGWFIHAYVLLPNHYHLLVQTPSANVSRIMRWLHRGSSGQRLQDPDAIEALSSRGQELVVKKQDFRLDTDGDRVTLPRGVVKPIFGLQLVKEIGDGFHSHRGAEHQIAGADVCFRRKDDIFEAGNDDLDVQNCGIAQRRITIIDCPYGYVPDAAVLLHGRGPREHACVGIER